MKSSKALPSTLSRRELKRRRAEAAKRSRNFFIAGAIGLVVVLAAAIVLTAGNESPTTNEPVGRAVTVSGEVLPTFDDTAAEEDPAIGMSIPEVEGTDFAGEPVSIRADGDPKMLIFLAHWCSHCQAEVPMVQEWLDTGGEPSGVDLISVSTSADPNAPNYPPSEWLASEGWSIPVIADDDASSVGRAFGVGGFPYFVFVDAEGAIAQRAAGELAVEQIEEYLAALRR